MRSESGSLPHNNVKVNGCQHSTCMKFKFTDQFECKPDTTVNRKRLSSPHLPGYTVHVSASFTLLTLLHCSLFLRLVRQLLFLLGIQPSPSVLSWSSLLPAFRRMLKMSRQCWAVPQWESGTTGGGQKKDNGSHTGRFVLQLGKWGAALGLPHKHSHHLHWACSWRIIRNWNLSHRWKLTYCVIWILSETTGQQTCVDLQVDCIVPSLGHIRSIQTPFAQVLQSSFQQKTLCYLSHCSSLPSSSS